ncbi:MAG: Rod shape-determining protein MreC, partial [Daejeonella sp.]|nr:Rod shape-determining protein MreC [Daejeonella sp.]
MRNLWLFISKYNAFFLLIIFLIISFVLLVNNNSYQKASTLNSSNQLVGEAYERVDKFTDYLSLGKTLDSLAAENARLRSQLKYSQYDTTLQKQTVNDTVTMRQYSYIVARVINNSIHQKNNYITINRGSLHGINKGMGVICPSGIVGVVQNVSAHFAVIRSLLHSDSRISASVVPGNAFGSL